MRSILTGVQIASSGATTGLVVQAGTSTASVNNKDITGGVATLTTSAAHGFIFGRPVVVAGVDATFNGTYSITAVTATTFSYTKSVANVASQAASGTARSTTQTAKAQQWQDTGGVTTFQVDTDGSLRIIYQGDESISGSIVARPSYAATSLAIVGSGKTVGSRDVKIYDTLTVTGASTCNGSVNVKAAGAGAALTLLTDGRIIQDLALGSGNGITTRAFGTQVSDLISWQTSGAVPLSRVNKDGYLMTAKVAAPADADVSASEMAMWLSDTAGAPTVRFKVKDSAGAVSNITVGAATPVPFASSARFMTG